MRLLPAGALLASSITLGLPALLSLGGCAEHPESTPAQDQAAFSQPLASEPGAGVASESATAAHEEATSIAVDGAVFRLQQCRMIIEADGAVVAELDTGLAGECFFATDGAGAPRVEELPAGRIALVMTSVPHEGDRFCDTRLRAVRIDPIAPAVSANEQRIQSCARGPHDRKLIEVLALSFPES